MFLSTVNISYSFAFGFHIWNRLELVFGVVKAFVNIQKAPLCMVLWHGLWSTYMEERPPNLAEFKKKGFGAPVGGSVG